MAKQKKRVGKFLASKKKNGHNSKPNKKTGKSTSSSKVAGNNSATDAGGHKSSNTNHTAQDKTALKKKKESENDLEEMDMDAFLNADLLDQDDEEDDDEDDFEEDDDEEEERTMENTAASAMMGESDDSDDDEMHVSNDDNERIVVNDVDDAASSSSEEDDRMNLEDMEKEERERLTDNTDTAATEERSVSEMKNVLTLDVLKGLEKKAFEQKSIKALRRLIVAFSDACKLKDGKEGDDNEENGREKSKFVIQSSAVYNHLMVGVLKNAHMVFKSHLTHAPSVIPLKTNKKKNVANNDMEEPESNDVPMKEASNEDMLTKMTSHPNWLKLQFIFRRFVSGTISLLSQVSDLNIQKFVLRQLAYYLCFITPCAKLSRRLLRVLLIKWSSISGDSTEEDDVCMLAYLRIRGLALGAPFPFIELCLKGIYLSYHRRTKFTTETSLRAFTLLGNCVVDLYGIDLTSSFQHAFVYIRQLALTLRRSILAQTKESRKQTLNWQFCNALKLWTAVLCAYPKTAHSAGLQALVYPLTQILYGTIRLIPTARYFPLRFHCITMLQLLAASTSTFIPSAPLLIDVLHSAELNRRPKGKSAGKPLDFSVCIKISKTALETQETQDMIASRTIVLLNTELDLYKYSIGFPEMTVPLLLSLRKFVTNNKVPRWTTMVKGLMQSTTKRSEWILSKRSQVTFSPRETTKMETFLEADAKSAKDRIVEQQQQQHAAAIRTYQDKVKHNKEENVKSKKNKKSQSNNSQETTSENLEKDNLTKAHRVFKSSSMDTKEFTRAMDEIDQEDIVQDLDWSDDENEVSVPVTAAVCPT